MAKFNKKLENLIKFVLEKQEFLKFSQFLCRKIVKFINILPHLHGLGVQQISFTSLQPPLAWY
jgi:hypothetical protein